MTMATRELPDGRSVYCLNTYEVDFSVHEIFGEDLGAHGIELPAEGVYFDVGANIGLFALYLHGLSPNARIFSYEPIPDTFSVLQKNLDVLEADAQAFRMGLGAEEGMLEFNYFPKVTALSSSNPEATAHLVAGLKKLMSGQGVQEDVKGILDDHSVGEMVEDQDFTDQLFHSERVVCPMSTVSKEMAVRGLSHIDLLKIDTEGSEKDVLAGIDDADWPRIRQLIVEVHLGPEETENIRRQLEGRGYQVSRDDHPMAQGGAPVFHLYATRKGT